MTIYNMTLSTTEPYNNVGAITVRQDDNLTQTFIANIVENGKPKTDLSGYQVFFNALFDGNIIARDLAQYDYGKNVATYTLRDSFFQQTGEVEAYFSFEKDGKRDSTANFSYYVTAGNCRNIRQGNYIYELEELLSVSDDIIKNKDFTVLLEENRKLNAKLEEVKSGFSSQVDELRKDFSRELTQTNKDVSEHESDKKNPHGVTASQVGAYSKSETDREIRKKVVKSKRIYDELDRGTYFYEKDKYNYNLSSNQELDHVKLVFARYDHTEPNTSDRFKYYGYTSYVFDAEDFRHGPNYVVLATSYHKLSMKQVYVTSEGVQGHDSNGEGDARLFVLKRITVYYTEK